MYQAHSVVLTAVVVVVVVVAAGCTDGAVHATKHSSKDKDGEGDDVNNGQSEAEDAQLSCIHQVIVLLLVHSLCVCSRVCQPV